MPKRYEFINFRKELSFIKNKYAFYWVALRTADLNSKCSCFSGASSPSINCRNCLGTGHLFIDKIVKAQRARSSPGLDFLTKIGKINTSTSIFILENQTKPKNSDWILELSLNRKTGTPRQPFKIIRSFKIQDSFPSRGTNSRIEFWYCHTEERNFTVGKDVMSSPLNKDNYLPQTKKAYSLLIQNILGEQSSLDLKNKYLFDANTVLNGDVFLELTPNSSPPLGKLLIKPLVGSISLIHLQEK